MTTGEQSRGNLKELRNKAQASLKSKAWPQAVEHCRAVMEAAGDRTVWGDYRRLARALEKNGEVHAARGVLQRASSELPEQVSSYLELAAFEGRVGDRTAAARAARNAVALWTELLPAGGAARDNQDQSAKSIYRLLPGADHPGGEHPAGEYSLVINGERIPGERDPDLRLQALGLHGAGLRVLDLGCRQGGMLFALGADVAWAVGLDCDPQRINLANRIKAHHGYDRLDFYLHNLEADPLSRIPNYLRSGRPDIIFMPSVAGWLKNWKDLVIFAKALAPNLIYEASMVGKHQRQELELLQLVYRSVELVWDPAYDERNNKKRKLYCCE